MAPKKVYARTACFIHEQHTNPPYSCLAHKSSVSRNWIFARTLNSTVATVCVCVRGVNCTFLRLKWNQTEKNIVKLLKCKKWPKTSSTAFYVFNIFTQDSNVHKQIPISSGFALSLSEIVLFYSRFDCSNAFVMTNSKSLNKSQTIHCNCLNFMLVTGNSAIWLTMHSVAVQMVWQ